MLTEIEQSKVEGYNEAIMDVANIILSEYLGVQNDANTDILFRKLRDDILTRTKVA